MEYREGLECPYYFSSDVVIDFSVGGFIGFITSGSRENFLLKGIGGRSGKVSGDGSSYIIRDIFQ